LVTTNSQQPSPVWIEPKVFDMDDELKWRSDGLTCGRAPEPPDGILTCGGEVPAVWADGCAQHGRGVPHGGGEERIAIRGIPYLRHAVVARRHDCAAVRAKAGTVGIGKLDRRKGKLLKCPSVPHMDIGTVAG